MDTQYAALPQSAAASGCGTAAGIIVPVPMAGSGGPLADTRPDWSTMILQGSFYHASTLVSRAKVTSDFFVFTIKLTE